MHSGFAALRDAVQMNIEASRPGGVWMTPVRRDLKRIIEMWNALCAESGQGGPLLFGAFSVAAALYVPVVSRFRTYGVALSDAASDYAAMMWELPAMREWVTATLAKKQFLAEEEPYRTEV